MFKLQYYYITFGQLILRKIIKIVATRYHILRLKCTKFDFGWGSSPDTAGGAHSAPPSPDPWAVFADLAVTEIAVWRPSFSNVRVRGA